MQRDHNKILIEIPNDGNCEGCIFYTREHDYDRIWVDHCLRFEHLLDKGVILETKLVNEKYIVVPYEECENGKYRG